MKIKGNRIPLNTSVVVLPRSDGNDIVFKFQAVQSFDAFEKMVPEPQPPTIMRPGESPRPDFSDADYKKEMDKYHATRIAYMVLESLKPTEGLEWEIVKLDDPTTWTQYNQEFVESGLAIAEITRIISEVMNVNGLSEDKLIAARDRFLASVTQPLTS